MNNMKSMNGNAVQIHQNLQCFVKLGLLHFWRSALPDDEKLIPLLLMEIGACLNNEELPNWSSYKDGVFEKICRQENNLTIAKLIQYYNLSPADIFLIALLGEIESNYLVNLIVCELQKPEESSRPSLHLLDNILEYCFGSSEFNNTFILSIAHHPLVKAGFIFHENQVGVLPLPLQKLRTTATIWQTLINCEQPWPDCKFIFANPSVVCAQINAIEIEQLNTVLESYYKPSATRAHSRLNGVIIRGAPNTGRHEFAARLAQSLSLNAMSIPLDVWKSTPLLHRLSAFCHWLPILTPSLGPGETFALETTSHPVIIILGTEGSVACDNLLEVRLQLPNAEERQQYWFNTINNAHLANQLGNNALLSEKTITTIGNYANRLAVKAKTSVTLQHIQQARRHQGAEKLRLLAEPIFRDIDINAMVLPPMVAQGLDHLIQRANKRESLWKGLGKTLKSTSNPGVRALLVGDSGTGKTLAASYIATQLSAPLYRVDLSSIMNKYIGESEKNLANLLDEAAANDVVLLFDEADSLFGSRSDGDNNGERFANMLTNFLLTRIENHSGVVILTTNSKERIDNAFNRRLDIIIDFPLPSFEERLALWESHLGECEVSDKACRELATYSDFTGGQIRNAVLMASVYATDGVIKQKDIWHGLKAEYHKLGRDIPRQLEYFNDVVECCA